MANGEGTQTSQALQGHSWWYIDCNYGLGGGLNGTGGITYSNYTYPAWPTTFSPNSCNQYAVDYSTIYQHHAYVAGIETEEQRFARIATEAAQASQRQQKQAEARVRARELLAQHLTEEQRKDFTAKNHFLVHTKRGVYRINHGIAGNIEFLGGAKDVRRERLCIHVPHSYGLPEEDHMLHQKLLLEADEEAFLRIANHSPLFS